MPADAKGIRTHPIQEIFWTRTGLLLLILVVVSGLSLWASSAVDPGVPRNLLTALGTGTMVSAVVGFGQTLITASAAQRAMVAPLVEESRKALHDLAAEYRSLNREFFPTDVFEASTEPDPGFNALIMADLRQTRQVWFRGFSGRYAAARILLSPGQSEVRAVLADPRERGAISGRARHLARQQGPTADYEAIGRSLHEEVRIGLVGLYLARSGCASIDVTVIADPPLDRVELFDDCVWLTLYSAVAGAPSLYPRTLRFSEGSFLYDMQRAEFARVHAARDAPRVVITPDTSREEFLAHFGKLTGTPLPEAEFHELEARFHRFRAEFSSKAELQT
ncbi:hypothetical protein V5P93_004775 [Actinokineospora auranticolor]|uniref:Uncharacterized protein n=1 Tax=Actinokineospora auranticolor TaxID=155976 RepID=A0A2S6GND7_9PSEU|nr:hypothetical protein [Actinokineospora auranticolor]PPK66738.1 hypothetical protein CLV40_109123 [Actinokineospora auranticolor]